ncbi:hypothetical protein GCM10010399_28390 [Dactylosporangium fulvum]|uniref:Uncharacterized protein n=1 Tax=Dactylosporangium fulvum TaxID=53359 RepID=A0ABY5W9X3_9ACTN|nr:hypothetical protein [Dactylosporangium fulvum]UWP86289.1 hypothetical protein Dfulv_19425 [Dactylosporangium fulvum]
MDDTGEASVRERAAVRLEAGDLSFFYRPRVDDDLVASVDEVQRLLLVLRPWTGHAVRLLVVGRKRLPDVSAHERAWCFVDRVVARPKELREALDERRYMTKTRGERVQPPARPAGEGEYTIARHDDHTHFAYALELPERPGPVQRDLNIETQAGFIVAVRNPRTPAPQGVGRAWTRAGRKGPELSPALLARFGGRRFSPLDPPVFLDHEGVELVLVGASRDDVEELGLHPGDRDAESAARGALLEELRIERRQHLLEPLLAGEWR